MTRQLSRNININWFEVVYLAIALATFQHTMWAGATVFEGPMPEAFHSAEWWRWHFNGALLAIAIDIGMLVTARQLRESYGKPLSWKLTMVSAFITAAIASFYTQILFSVHHTNTMTIGSGVSDYWNGYLDPIIQARVILVPLMLPLFAVIFTLASIITHTTEVVIEEQEKEKEIIRIKMMEEERKRLPPPKFKFQGRSKTWYFNSEAERDQFAEKYNKKLEKRRKNSHNGHRRHIELGEIPPMPQNDNPEEEKEMSYGSNS